MRTTRWIPLFDGSSLREWGDYDPTTVSIDNGDLVFANAGPGCFKAELKDASDSWDDYTLTAEVLFRRLSSEGTFCIQLTGNGTRIYSQIVPGWSARMVLRAFWIEANGCSRVPSFSSLPLVDTKRSLAGKLAVVTSKREAMMIRRMMAKLLLRDAVSHAIITFFGTVVRARMAGRSLGWPSAARRFILKFVGLNPGHPL